MSQVIAYIGVLCELLLPVYDVFQLHKVGGYRSCECEDFKRGMQDAMQPMEFCVSFFNFEFWSE